MNGVFPWPGRVLECNPKSCFEQAVGGAHNFRLKAEFVRGGLLGCMTFNSLLQQKDGNRDLANSGAGLLNLWRDLHEVVAMIAEGWTQPVYRIPQSSCSSTFEAKLSDSPHGLDFKGHLKVTIFRCHNTPIDLHGTGRNLSSDPGTALFAIEQDTLTIWWGSEEGSLCSSREFHTKVIMGCEHLSETAQGRLC